jgi:hypothetical protein
MGDLVKKNNPVAFPNMPSLPSMFQNTLPPEVPQIQYKGGLVPIVENFIHNWKLGQIERASEREANIAENTNRRQVAMFKGIEDLLLFGPRYNLKMKGIEHELTMMDIAERKAEAELQGIQFKNKQEYHEAQIAELDYKVRYKEAKSNGLFDEED